MKSKVDQVRKERSDSSADLHSISFLIGQGIFQIYLIIFLCIFIAPFFAFNNITQFLILFEPEYECNPIENSNLIQNFRNFENYVRRKNNVIKSINPTSLFIHSKRDCFSPFLNFLLPPQFLPSF